MRSRATTAPDHRAAELPRICDCGPIRRFMVDFESFSQRGPTIGCPRSVGTCTVRTKAAGPVSQSHAIQAETDALIVCVSLTARTQSAHLAVVCPVAGWAVWGLRHLTCSECVTYRRTALGIRRISR